MIEARKMEDLAGLSQRYRESLGKWVQKRQPWDWWMLMTWRDEKMNMKCGLAEMRHNRFLKLLSKETGLGLIATGCVERQRRGTPHTHSLIKTDGLMNLKDVHQGLRLAQQIWKQTCGETPQGYMNINEVHGDAKAIGMYCGKYICKDISREDQCYLFEDRIRIENN